MTDDELSRRQLAKQARRKAGDRSGDLARTFMQMKAATFEKLQLDEELREAIEKARAIPSQIARRRAERALAGDLRRFEMAEIADQIASAEATGAAEPQQLHLAERWRTRLIEEDAAAAEFPSTLDSKLIENARRETTTGKPPGAKRALFRAIVAALKTPTEPK